MQRRGRALAAAALGFAALVAVAFAAELSLRALENERRDEGFPPGLFVPESLRGYTLAPGARVSARRMIRFEIAANEDGYRDGSWRTFDGRPRVLVTGSSATFGFGVPVAERLTERLEHHLGGGFKVLNAALYGYGPPQARATIERECPRVRPALVLYVHEYKLTRRDFLREDARTVIDGVLVNRPPPAGAGISADAQSVPPLSAIAAGPFRLPQLRAWLRRYGWHPTQLAETIVGRDRLPEGYVRARYVATSPSGEFPANGPVRAAGEIGGMAVAARDCGAGFALVLLPGPFEHWYLVEEPATAKLKAAVADRVRVIDLRRVLTDRPVLMLDGLDYFDARALDGFAAALARQVRTLVAGSART